MRKKTKQQIEDALNLVRHALQADGGDVELVDVSEDGIVKVNLTGACGSCPMSTMTLKMGIGKTLKDEAETSPAIRVLDDKAQPLWGITYCLLKNFKRCTDNYWKQL